MKGGEFTDLSNKASAPRQLLLRCSTSCIHAVVLTPEPQGCGECRYSRSLICLTYIPVGKVIGCV